MATKKQQEQVIEEPELLELAELPDPAEVVPVADVEDDIEEIEIGLLQIGAYEYQIDAEFGLSDQHAVQRLQALISKYKPVIDAAQEGRTDRLEQLIAKGGEVVQITSFEAKIAEDVLERFIDNDEKALFVARYNGRHTDGTRVPKAERIQAGEILTGYMRVLASGSDSNPKT